MYQVQSKALTSGADLRIWGYEDGNLLGLQSFLAEQSPTILSRKFIKMSPKWEKTLNKDIKMQIVWALVD